MSDLVTIRYNPFEFGGIGGLTFYHANGRVEHKHVENDREWTYREMSALAAEHGLVKQKGNGPSTWWAKPETGDPVSSGVSKPNARRHDAHL